jgi:hypothetical protein
MSELDHLSGREPGRRAHQVVEALGARTGANFFI